VDPTYTDGVVLIRPMDVRDAEAHVAGEDDEIVRWLTYRRGTLESNRAWIASTHDRWRDGGPQFVFGIRDAATDELAGTIDARTTEDDLAPGQVNIAYSVHARWRGRGMATRAVALMLRFLRTRPDIREAVIRVAPANGASAAVARKARFRYAGRHGDDDEYRRRVTSRTPQVSCVFVGHDGAGRVLLARRGPGARDEPGTWDCGAGALEFGETFEEAVAREVTEEYATVPLEVELLGVRNVLRDDHWVAIVFAVRIDPDAARIGEPDKFDALGWFAPGALPSPLHSQLAPALAMAQAVIRPE
jgi:8-oxo-dGTP diphosphatase